VIRSKPQPLLHQAPPQADFVAAKTRGGKKTVEATFEYQVSLELAEQIAMERLHLILRSWRFFPKFPQLWIGILMAVIGAATPFVSIGVNRGDYELAERILGAALGFALGFGFSLLIRRAIRIAYLTNARDTYKKLGSPRAVSWNSDAVTLKTSAWDSKIGWWTIEKIQIEKVGVYGFFLGRIFFVIPKSAFPANATAENFVQTWQTQIKQPPPIKTVSNL
jgi:hypothetical protein